MAFVNAQQIRVLWSSQALTAYLRSVKRSVSVGMIDTTVLSDTAHAFTPDVKEWSLDVEGLLDTTTTAGSLWAAITVDIPAGTTRPVSIASEGFAAGKTVWLIPAKGANYEVGAAIGSAVQFSAGFLAGETAPAFGFSYADLAAMIITTTSSNLDNTAQSLLGGVAHLHCTAASGATPTCTVTIQDSSTGNSGWATIGTFTQLTSTGSQTLAIAGTIKQYTRAVFTIGGSTPSFTAQCSLARY